MKPDIKNSEWKFVEKKSKKFNLQYWIKELLNKIENDDFSIKQFIN